jgi:hypothetical protein
VGVKRSLRKHGCKRSHLAEILSVYPTREIQVVVKSVLRKRKYPKVKSQLESWLETFFMNYYERNGKFPPKQLVRETIAKHFPKIKLRNGKLPPTKELLLIKIYSRLYMRLKREQKKAKEDKS